MNIEFRIATLKDVEELVNKRVEFLGEVHKLSQDEKIALQEANSQYFNIAIQNGSYLSFIALLEGEIIGTSGITFYNVPPNKKCATGRVAYISNMFTSKEHRGKGVATTLFNHIIREAKEHRVEKLMLNATDMGKPLYEKFGFTETSGDMEFIIK